jgi:HEAT repeat protein
VTGSLPLPTEEQRRTDEVARLAAGGKAAIPALIERLAEPGWAVRRAVVAALAAAGDDAVGPLADVLRHRRDDEARLAAAVDALVASVGRADEEAMRLAEEPAPAVASDGAQILGRRRTAGAVPLLGRLAEHPHDVVAVGAIEALGRIGGRAAVEPLVRAVESRSFFRTFPALDVLGRSGDPRAVAPLATLLEDPYYGLEAARALGHTGDRRAIGPLARLLAAPSDAIVRRAALALAELDDRHLARTGRPAPLGAELGAALPKEATARRLVRVVGEGEPDERVAICRLLGALGCESALPALGQLLDAPQPVAKAAAEALRRIGREAEERLLELLREGGSGRRKVVLPLIQRGSAAGAVAACLRDPDPDVRVLASEVLGRLGNPAATPALFEVIGDPNLRVAQAAIGAVQALGGTETERLATAAARSEDPRVRLAAVRILSYFGFGAATEPLLEAAREDDPRLCDAALQGLALLPDPRAEDALIDAARDAGPGRRAAAMRALGRGEGGPRAVARLVQGLADDDPWVRYYAIQALGRLGYHPVAAAIARHLHDPAGQVRVAAVEALALLEGEAARSALREAAHAEDPDIRRAAVIGMGIARGPEMLPLVLDGAGSEDAATRLVAVSALAGFDDPAATAALVRAARDRDESVRNAAVGFLAGRAGDAAATALVELLGTATPRDRIVAALATPAPGRAAALVAALDAADDDTAPLLASALARMGTPEADAALLEAAHLPSAVARKAVAGVLAARGDRASIEELRRLVARDPDAEVRRVSALYLVP